MTCYFSVSGFSFDVTFSHLTACGEAVVGLFVGVIDFGDVIAVTLIVWNAALASLINLF